MLRTRAAFVLVPLLAFALPSLAGTPKDTHFTETVFASGGGISDATGMCWATDGSNTLFLSQKGDGNGGHLRVILNGSLQATDFATVSPVFLNSECGLDNVVVDPNYASNKYVYVFITETSSVQRIYRYTAGMSGGNLVGTGKTQIGPDLPTWGQNHDGGGMAIGPDGHLYVGVGNNGNGNGPQGNGNGRDGNPEEFNTLASKITRMDRFTGAAIPGGPFAGRGTMGNYMFAKGVRNPFGLRFHPTTGDLWLTAVGDGYEQIFLVPPGGDEGWPTENNTSTTNGLLIPKFDYVTNNSIFGGALTRGIFYNGTQFPAQYRGDFFFCDYNAGQLARAHMDASGKNITAVDVFVTGVNGMVDVSVGPDGALYYVGRGQNNVYRLVFNGPSQGIVVSTSSLTLTEGGSGTFGAHLAVQPAGNLTVSVSRSSGNANLSAAPASITFTPGDWNTNHSVTVTSIATPDNVNDNATITLSAAGLSSQNVQVTALDTASQNAPTAKIFAPTNGQTVSGTGADFYGYGYPKAPATLTKAEFFIDGALKYTDPYNPAVGHFHYNGGHAQWNTTLLTNATHMLKMTVFDSQNLSGSDQITVTVDNAGPLPAPWLNRDVGSVGLAGSATDSGAFTVKGSGTDIWGTSDAFQFVYQTLPGDGSAVARVTGMTSTDPWAKAGVMIRESLTAGSRHAMMVLTPGNGAAFQRRVSTSGASTHTSGGAASAPLWVKVTRTGNTFSGYRSSDGVTWTLVGSDTIPMAASAFVGLAVTSHNNSLLCTATLDSVSIHASAVTVHMGETTVLGADDSGNANLLLAQETTLGQAATLQSLSFYVTQASGKLRMGVYDATGPGGGPGAKRAETAEITPGLGWNTAPVTAPTGLAAGSYWLAYLPSDNNLHFRADRSTGNIAWYSYSYGPMATTFSSAPQTGTAHWSFYATLTAP